MAKTGETNFENLALVGGFTLLAIVAGIAYFMSKKKRQQATDNGHSKLITLKSPDIKYNFVLAYKESISHDTRLFRFQLPSSSHVLGLPVGQHIYLTTHINGDLVKRPYTPTTSDDQQGHFDLVIKVYPQGKMTQYLDKLHINDSIEVNGPSGNLIYKNNGIFDIRTRKPEPYKSKKIRQLGMIAGGTGITPMYQILCHILKEEENIEQGGKVDLKIWLLFANQTEQDILLREELELLTSTNSDRFRLWYTVDRPPTSDWKYSTGFVSEQMIREHMPPSSEETLICCCGPPPMIKAQLTNLEKLNYTESMRFTF
ncbi:unnamed protein product [Didymodactylos carnosus]|uniref:NADH-cytochrome b5 reductase n=1 Tax=Didymodactylos carnosus TaxID=1234261 RepID=A0A814AGA3_9BILA|nr:unnamed protein product [Didymodactylos carnosus]CAF1333194.1 unnamed protein product [Didymodactylos carnosus]CAF3693193.1 unnamed protein product [Didymodactylos carnosus]CAF4144585.1 unnamed protein product [Didymodactylos carnosus]